MMFADSVFGWACFSLILILVGIGWVVGRIGKAAGNVLKSGAVQEAARIGFWTWFLSDY